MDDKQVIAWAGQEIRELDELCRSMVPDYAPLDSSDMQKLAHLKGLAGDAEVPASTPDHEALLRDAEASLSKMNVAFAALDFAKVKEELGRLTALVVNRQRSS
jgi:hypothetical protein